MPQAPLPDNEHERLQALAELDITYLPLEHRLDKITRTARYLFAVPIAYI
ncbi:hypothetical protein [Bacterioplanes sanyensis]|nr:hypothetical protein [Bacterioplanes sanyensis]